MELHQFSVGSLVLTPFDERNRHHELLETLLAKVFHSHSVLQLDLTVFYQTTPIDESSWSKHEGDSIEVHNPELTVAMNKLAIPNQLLLHLPSLLEMLNSAIGEVCGLD
ncbi:hypothetical protein AAG906_035108 [Vitis piasezkii]